MAYEDRPALVSRHAEAAVRYCADFHFKALPRQTASGIPLSRAFTLSLCGALAA
jgi:hypothetical protein